MLLLELRAGETLIVNGAPILFRRKTKIELREKVRFLFGKQIMQPHEADTPAQKIYFAIQIAYIGSGNERRAGLALAEQLVEQFYHTTALPLVTGLLDRALIAANAGEYYEALKLVRSVVQHENASTQTLGSGLTTGARR